MLDDPSSLKLPKVSVGNEHSLPPALAGTPLTVCGLHVTGQMVDVRPLDREGVMPTDLFEEQLRLLAEPLPQQSRAAIQPSQLEFEEDNMFSVEFANGAAAMGAGGGD